MKNVREELLNEIAGKIVVEFGLVQDIETLYKTFSEISIASIKEKTRIQSEIKKLVSDLEKAKKAKDEAVRKNELIKKSAKDLGLELPDISKKIDNSNNFPIERTLSWANESSKS
jgi:predicted  nucleic acid-binding Zn-ribbon protein